MGSEMCIRDSHEGPDEHPASHLLPVYLRERAASPSPHGILTAVSCRSHHAWWAAIAAMVLAVCGLAWAQGARAGEQAGAASPPRVLAIHFDHEVNPVTEGFLSDRLRKAARERYDAAVILLDTPGGLSESMRKIVKAELASPIPVIVYVTPAGVSSRITAAS